VKEDKPMARANEARKPVQHPVGTTTGGVMGAAAAAAVAGSVAGPVGAVAGAVIGAAAGAMTGRAFAELIDPDEEVAFWRDQWQPKAGNPSGYKFEQDFRPAYRYGVEAFTGNADRHFNEIEPQLGEGWPLVRGTSRLDWNDARMAALDAWQRAYDLSHRRNS
jgi:hypothetical protein